MDLYVGPHTKMINLKGKTLLPGFVDAHSHFGDSAVVLNQDVSLQSPPFGNIKSI